MARYSKRGWGLPGDRWLEGIWDRCQREDIEALVERRRSYSLLEELGSSVAEGRWDSKH